jgi:hypothetical protein
VSEVDADLVSKQLHRVVIACNLVVVGQSYGALDDAVGRGIDRCRPAGGVG